MTKYHVKARDMNDPKDPWLWATKQPGWTSDKGKAGFFTIGEAEAVRQDCMMPGKGVVEAAAMLLGAVPKLTAVIVEAEGDGPAEKGPEAILVGLAGALERVAAELRADACDDRYGIRPEGGPRAAQGHAAALGIMLLLHASDARNAIQSAMVDIKRLVQS